jgi:hypothetical protein
MTSSKLQDSTLKKYSVTLTEDKGDKFKMNYECSARDADEAADLAQAAYPNGDVLHVGQV